MKRETLAPPLPTTREEWEVELQHARRAGFCRGWSRGYGQASSNGPGLYSGELEELARWEYPIEPRRRVVRLPGHQYFARVDEDGGVRMWFDRECKRIATAGAFNEQDIAVLADLLARPFEEDGR